MTPKGGIIECGRVGNDGIQVITQTGEHGGRGRGRGVHPDEPSVTLSSTSTSTPQRSATSIVAEGLPLPASLDLVIRDMSLRRCGREEKEMDGGDCDIDCGGVAAEAKGCE